MEFCAGGDLSRFIRMRRILPEKVARVFLQQLGESTLPGTRAGSSEHPAWGILGGLRWCYPLPHAPLPVQPAP